VTVAEHQFPFWAVTDAEAADGSSQPSPKAASTFYAFSKAATLFDYPDAHGPGVRKVALIANREALLRAIADAQLNGATSIRFDPQPNGAGGRRVQLRRLLR
jgi:hypothetical protein